LQAAANNRECSAQVTWKTASKISKMFIDQPSFALRYEAEGPEGVLHQYVDHYDDAGLVLKTNQLQQHPVTQHTEPESSRDKWTKDAVKRMKQKK
jgi:hypothetical protein